MLGRRSIRRRQGRAFTQQVAHLTSVSGEADRIQTVRRRDVRQSSPLRRSHVAIALNVRLLKVSEPPRPPAVIRAISRTDEQVMTTRRNDCAIRNRADRAPARPRSWRPSCTGRSQPTHHVAATVMRRIRVVVDLDEVVARARRSARPQLANQNCAGGVRRRDRARRLPIGDGRVHCARRDSRGTSRWSQRCPCQSKPQSKLS